MGKTSKLTCLAIYAIAMAYIEAIVVFYYLFLRGFLSGELPEITPDSTPGRFLREHKIYHIEQIREAATIVMMITVSWVSGRKWLEKLAMFLWIFAFWDIFYYVFLHVLTKWPSSLFELDVLFLIPIPLVLPVIAPIAICIIMLCFSVYIVFWKLD